MQAVARLSSSSSKRVSVGIFKGALKSNLLGRCKSYATSVKGQTVILQKVPKRIPRQERRVAIASFVEKYRASNEGRFPTISLVNKEVGGSYYTTREIVQELEYRYKLAQAGQSHLDLLVDLKESSSVTSSETIGEKVAPTLDVVKEVSTKRGKKSTIFEAEETKKEEVCGTAADVSLDEQSHVVVSTIVEVPIETSINTTINMDKEQPSLKVKKVKKARKVETRTQTLQETPVAAEKIKINDDVTEPDKVPEKPNSNEHDQYSTMEGSIWGNLKSFSDKIINFWKKF